MEFEKEIRRAVDTGRVDFGYRSSEKNVLNGKGKLLVVSKELPKEKKERLNYISKLSEIPVFEANQTPLKLGSICGKPFPITSMVVLEKGKSKILSIASQKKQ